MMQQNKKNFTYEVYFGEWQSRNLDTDLSGNFKDSDVLVVSFDADLMQTTITHKATGALTLQDCTGETYADAYMILANRKQIVS